MEIIFQLAEKFVKPFISINAQNASPDLIQLSVALDRVVNQLTFIGYGADEQVVVPFYQVIRLYTEQHRVVCETSNGIYQIHARMYELRDQVRDTDLLPVSNAEIVNQSLIKSFALTKSGSFVIHLTNGETVYSSRRYVKTIKEALLK